MIDAERIGCVLLLGFELGCQRPGTEGSGSGTAAASTVRTGPELAPASTARGEPDGAVGTPSSGSELGVGGARPSEPVGGRWVSCYSNYRATSTPERDLGRLTALCGPANGMIPAGPVIVGDAIDTAEDHKVEARAGDCFRIFAIADAFVSDLGVEVVNPRGNAITWDRNGDRWPILNPDGPFCLFDAGTYTVRVRALQGKGRYAMQVWRLP
jgi:hypothetical protein